MADFGTYTPVTPEVASTLPEKQPWVPKTTKAQPYIEYRDSRPIGQLWPRGGLPEGQEAGPQAT